MSDQPTFSLTVVTGDSAGQTVQSARKRISVGSARDNDLVLADPGVAPRHFLVLIDGKRWRIHTLTDQDVSVDRRWVHPVSGKRGALIRAAASEVILFAGALDAATIKREVGRRRGVEDATEMATSISLKPLAMEDPNEPTVSVRAVDNPHTVPLPKSGAPEDLDLAAMAQMPTIAGERPPDELRQAAQKMLERRRTPNPGGPVAPSVLRDTGHTPKPELSNAPIAGGPLPGPGRADERTVGLRWTPEAPPPPTSRGRSRWDNARRASTVAPPTDDNVPEVLATPESQMMPVPGASKSAMSQRPDLSGSSSQAQVIPIGPDPRARRPAKPAKSKNAWGDPAGRALVPTRDAEERKNAWEGGGAPAGAPRKKKKKKSAWGDGANRGSQRPPDPPAPNLARTPEPPREALANRIDLTQLARGTDAALEILTRPDGNYATQVRLLGAKIDENAKSLGYRAYMVTSPEPLTGKTTAACNLAFALAEDTQRRVALVEANFRYPRFAEIFGLRERAGLISVLDGRERLKDVGYKLSDRNLVILPAGGRHTAPAEVLASPRFKALVAELVDTVDIAIIDAPSVTDSADANLILPLVDAAFLVVAESQTRRSWLGRAMGQLGERRVLGSLFNRIPKKTLKVLDQERRERQRSKA